MRRAPEDQRRNRCGLKPIRKINGERIKVIYDSIEAKTNVPKSLEELNYKIIEISKLEKSNFYIIIEK